MANLELSDDTLESIRYDAEIEEKEKMAEDVLNSFSSASDMYDEGLIKDEDIYTVFLESNTYFQFEVSLSPVEIANILINCLENITPQEALTLGLTSHGRLYRYANKSNQLYYE